MVMKSAIRIEVAPTGIAANFHFRSSKPIGATMDTLKLHNYRRSIDYLRHITSDGRNLVTELFAIPGITDITVYQYEVGVLIGRAYSIEEIIPKAAAIIATLFYCYEDSSDRKSVV